MKQIAFISLILLTIFSFCLPVHAHGGRTDGSGGHTDHSTGEYHYHHGYPAHDHYDIDGDGTVDCPFDFIDRTGENSGISSKVTNSNGISSQSSSKASDPEPTSGSPSKTTSVQQEHEKEEKNVPTWVYLVFAAQFVISLALFFSNRSKREEIKSISYSNQNALDAMKQSCEKQIAKKNASDKELQQVLMQIKQAEAERKQLQMVIAFEQDNLREAKLLRSRIKNAPLDVSFAEDGLPIYWKPHMMKPYGDYTVYTNEKSHIYHVDRLCASYRASERHIFHVIDRYRPCRKCAEGFFDFETAPAWFKSTL